jgi:hypothetical protein
MKKIVALLVAISVYSVSTGVHATVSAQFCEPTPPVTPPTTGVSEPALGGLVALAAVGAYVVSRHRRIKK